MGLLTDPRAGQGYLTRFLLQSYKKICFLMFVTGIMYFFSLAFPSMNQSTYFSENALLPGLVKSEFHEDVTATHFHEELLEEMKKYDNSMPYPWLLAKLRQIGLDVYTHNFTLNYPLGKTTQFYGKNVYGILRAPRASSTESLVISVPYRPPISVHQTTTPSIAIMLAFAKFARKEKYWAKDIIFLITEHEQLGIQAWLEAYHGISCGDEGVMNFGVLKGRAGAIQAAINLELHDKIIGQIDVKIEGLNGQLPNLDLFNLATKMCSNENVYHTFKQRHSRNFRNLYKDWTYSFKTLMSMVATQATGVPNGNHGLFHRFGIEALTIEGFANANLRGTSKVGFRSIGRIIEGIFRSLNNLLERLHQSFFFYLLPSSDRFISIGLYMPAICLIAGTLLIKACANWCQLKKEKEEKEKLNNIESDDNTLKIIDNFQIDQSFDKITWNKIKNDYNYELKRDNFQIDVDSIDVKGILIVQFIVHFIGILIMNSPQWITKLGIRYNYSNESSIFLGFILLSILTLLIPLTVRFRYCEKSMKIFQIISTLELGTALICVSMNNFSLSLFLSIIYVPFALLISSKCSLMHSIIQRIFWLILHPLLVLILTIIIYSIKTFPDDNLRNNFYRSISATQQAIIFSIVDSMIYGNWLFSVITAIFFSNWLSFWIVTFSHVPSTTLIINKKNK